MFGASTGFAEAQAEDDGIDDVLQPATCLLHLPDGCFSCYQSKDDIIEPILLRCVTLLRECRHLLNTTSAEIESMCS